MSSRKHAGEQLVHHGKYIGYNIYSGIPPHIDAYYQLDAAHRPTPATPRLFQVYQARDGLYVRLLPLTVRGGSFIFFTCTRSGDHLGRPLSLETPISFDDSKPITYCALPILKALIHKLKVLREEKTAQSNDD
jgi:hypothetical protein